MIKKIFITERPDKVKLYLTYSDEGKYIYKEDKPSMFYVEAIDVESATFKYIESDELIKHKE